MWDFEKNSEAALLQMWNDDVMETKLQVDFNLFHKTYKTINAELWQLYGLHKITKEELRYQRFYLTFQFFKFNDLQLANTWADKYVYISPRKTNLVNGTLDILNHLKPNYQLHLITNGFKEAQYLKIENCNLNHYFKHIIVSEEVGYHKPHIKIFELAQTFTNSQAHECIMIGDSYESDIEGAINAGWKAIYYTHLKEVKALHKNTIIINKLEELKTLF